jgi:hypothetical protein
MTACSYCGKAFGRVRTTLDALSWNEQFCSRRCADQGRKEWLRKEPLRQEPQQQERIFQFLRAVGPSPSGA